MPIVPPEVSVAANLAGKVALVTGASQGIGATIASALARAGAHVVAAARQAEKVEELAASIVAAGGAAEALRLDVTEYDETRERVKSIVKKHGHLDILVNNAGTTDDHLLVRMSKESWDRVMATNLDGVFNVSQEAVKAMMKQRWGRIVSISSVVGLMGNPGQTNYCASKAGLIGFTKSLAREVGSRGITVNAIAPGFIQTAMTADLAADVRTRLESQVALGRLGDAADVAWGVLFLVSEQAGYITGEVLNISGGLYM